MRHVIGVYRGMQHAREAMAALERRGVDAAEIGLHGDPSIRAAARADTTERDGRLLGAVGRRLRFVGGIGMLAGALVGLGIGLSLASSTWLLAVVAAGAIAGSLVGALFAGTSGLEVNDAWELTFDSLRRGRTVVEVTTADPEEAEQAHEILRQAEAEEVGVFDDQGHRLAA